jgi:hypothetical protein
MQTRIGLFAALTLVFCVSASAQNLHLESPGSRVSLLELYTSEGCSSCPPADRWISTLRDDPRLWREVVPVAFHVDYWDYIGWKDRFASPVYGNRQRDYARSRRVGTVYTPGFVLAGKEWRSWFYRPVLKVETGAQAGKLELSINQGKASATFAPPKPITGELEIHVAVLGFGLQTEVRAGENGGSTLKHDFVVLGYDRFPTIRRNSLHTASFTLPPVSVDADRTAVAAWLSAPDDPNPVQAVGGWLSGAEVQ